MTMLLHYSAECDGEECASFVPSYGFSERVAEQYAREAGWQQVIHKGKKVHYCTDCKDALLPDWESDDA